MEEGIDFLMKMGLIKSGPNPDTTLQKQFMQIIRAHFPAHGVCRPRDDIGSCGDFLVGRAAPRQIVEKFAPCRRARFGKVAKIAIAFDLGQREVGEARREPGMDAAAVADAAVDPVIRVGIGERQQQVWQQVWLRQQLWMM